ncbi:MAG: hypothetical protein HUU21_04415 [Polyangiaceae bacterium]|nr:hypothetical protein [Polyangiaceae bacterium]
MRIRSSLRFVRGRLALVLVSALSACSQGGEGSSRPAASARPAAPSTGPWSRSESAVSEKEASDAGPPPQAAAVDQAALEEILAAVPKRAVPSTGPDGTSAVGTDTGLKSGDDDAESDKPAATAATVAGGPGSAGKVSFGTLSIQGEMASASVEREARAQLYWGLVQRCRDKDGSILPPDVVKLSFTIDEDGYIISSSIIAAPSKLAYEDAAHCMRRELSAATFRAPVGARGLTTPVVMTVPSVD